ncbi:maleylpyruvate isomerase family mycothiol-dependent enzyme [Granulicella arctica]|uniref:Uncharacterized protein (TIGR03083 family) n=1 Tax=Granulicella arctica TaxID=940613 RepID=A0A7Y9TGP2_9BACT|nr:maleylpyruvate isomerase family mycothiol-dependent enzyme [Granulicella arctica]NYF79689.1 uncharacterized protein (TIGR03083 family) [Granulicella arctica]
MPQERTPPQPILLHDRFNEIRTLLLELLNSLSPDDWQQPTAAPLWSVKDVALHLLGGDLSNLSRRRDQHRPPPDSPIDSYQDLVAFINRHNADWVRASRRISPHLLCDLLAFTGPQLATYFASLDPFALGDPVDWAGPDPAPVWLDIAREYTEQWHHQQQIRDATHRPPLYTPHLFALVLDTFLRAMPHSYSNTAAPEGTTIHIEITGEAGNQWFLERSSTSWELLTATSTPPTTHISIPQDTAWRLFTKGIRPEQALSHATITGDPAMAPPFFHTLSVLA